MEARWLFVKKIINFAVRFYGHGKSIYRVKLINLNKKKVNTLSYKTVSANAQTVQKEWLLVDAEGQSLGRVASKVAVLIRGKHKPSYTPHVDCGDNVIVINAEKVVLTGNKWEAKEYVRHTGYPGGQRNATAREVFEKDPTRLVTKAVYGMLPKNKLGAALNRNLRVFVGDVHGMDAQKPKLINLKDIK